MKILHVEPKESGTVAKRTRSTTADLASGYQRTSNTNSGVSAVETTGGYLLIEIANLPWYSPISFNEPTIEIMPDLAASGISELVEGYKEMAVENSLIAERSLPIACESWPDWKE